MKKKAKISGKMMIAQIIEKWPDLAEVLTTDYGFHCIGCYGSGMETLSEGAMVHGMDKKEIRVMLENLNELVDKK